jgi:hypothetical protein
MIRVDEIYNHTFWPWINQHLPLTRMFFCDPPGDTGPESLFNFGEALVERNYIWFHDQEPIYLDTHLPLFDDVVRRNSDLNYQKGPVHRAIITSERDSDFVAKICKMYGWQSYYYFYHGWAALDWYRGYNRTFVVKQPEQRNIHKSFISPNRIIGGHRDHRVLLMYQLLKRKIKNAWISFPRVCPVENIDVVDIAAKFSLHYTDISTVLSDSDLPRHFPGESTHPMHSCWLSLFDENCESLAHVITETVQQGRRHHLTEKTFKPICLQMPFIMVSTAGSLEYLRSYGFKTFSSVWDEDYDYITNDLERIERIADMLKYLDDCTAKELQQLYHHCMPMIKHNYQHFYGGNFENVLWKELTGMMQAIERSWH